MKKMHHDIQELFICRCGYTPHQVVIRTIDFDEDPEVYVEVALIADGFFKRLVHGIKYIFGYRNGFGAFDEIILRPEDAPRLQRVVDMLEEARRRSA